MKQLPTNHVYRLIEPGPILLVVTQRDGTPNVMTMGFHMVVQHDPPVLACVLGPWDYSYQTLRMTGECVLAIPPADMAEIVVDIGNCSGKDEDKFARFGLAARPAARVSPPLLSDCIANIECRVLDESQVEERNLWILSVECLWIEDRHTPRSMLHHRGDGSFVTDGRVVDFSQKMVKWRDLPG